MANILDKIIQKVDLDAKDTDKNTKAYSNMMVYLRELKLHNVKNLELAEQIFELSEENVEKLNEMHDIILNKLQTGDEEDKKELLALKATVEELQSKWLEANDNNVRTIKHEISVYNDVLESLIKKESSKLEEQIASTRTTLITYAKIIIWLLFVAILLLAFKYLFDFNLI